ncbi:SafA/ExsA family spore coat assembly protein [Halobacillus campisalis]|uniref:SafA/ExsA family spore coat assembly protein n=1 Tax=Halobacillus campisalis TaxID=435909 RepID=A0ABW2K2N5_9BACI|nr:SafA/ExsA family spore coat assembly protein [Halobacillus campisalis]
MRIHIVQKGDTLWKISKKYGVNFEELKSVNSQLSNPDMIMPGMKIKVPQGKTPVKKEAPKKENVKKEAPKKEAPKKEMPKPKPKTIPKPIPQIKEDEKMPQVNKPMPMMEKPMMPIQMNMPIQMPMDQHMQNYYTTFHLPQMPAPEESSESPVYEKPMKPMKPMKHMEKPSKQETAKSLPMEQESETKPMQSMPMQNMPMQSMPMQNIPMQSMPMQNMPMHSMPKHSMPMQNMPMQNMPKHSMPMQNMPMHYQHSPWDSFWCPPYHHAMMGMPHSPQMMPYENEMMNHQYPQQMPYQNAAANEMYEMEMDEESESSYVGGAQQESDCGCGAPKPFTQPQMMDYGYPPNQMMQPQMNGWHPYAMMNNDYQMRGLYFPQQPPQPFQNWAPEQTWQDDDGDDS